MLGILFEEAIIKAELQEKSTRQFTHSSGFCNCRSWNPAPLLGD